MEHQEGEPLNQIDIYLMMPETVNFIQRFTGLVMISCEPVVQGDDIIGIRFQLARYEGIREDTDVQLRYISVCLNNDRLEIGFEDEDGFLPLPMLDIDDMKLEYMKVCELVGRYGFEPISYVEVE